MKKGIVVLLVVLILLVLGMGGYLVYDKVLSKGSETFDEKNSKDTTNEITKEDSQVLSDEEALSIGQQLWDYSYKTLWCENFEYSEITTDIGNGLIGFEILNYNDVKEHFTDDFTYEDYLGNKISWKERFEEYVVDGKVYDPSICGRGSSMSYSKTQLSVKSITSDTLMFDASSTYCDDAMFNENKTCKNEQSTEEVKKDFILKLVDNDWKIFSFYLPN